MSRILVVYYSLSGRTRRVGESIALACGGDSEEIREAASRGGLLGWLRSLFEARRGRTPPILPAEKAPKQYDLVVLGSPVWGHTVSSPMRSYLMKYRQDLNSVALFVTEGSSGGDRALEEMTALCGQKPVATLIAKANEISSDAFRKKIASFVHQLLNGHEPQPRKT